MPSGTLRVRACPHDHRADDTDPSPPTRTPRTPHRREATGDPVRAPMPERRVSTRSV